MSPHVSTKVQEVLAYYWNEALPVNVEHIAHLIGVNVRYDSIIDNKANLSGMFKYDEDNNTPTCFIRSSDSYTRRRFTLAHELGHFLLGHQSPEGRLFRDDDVFAPQQNHQQEKEANQFAAELLMPEFRVHSLIKNTTQTLSSLAQTFGVSENTMTFRLRNLGYHI